MTDQDRKRIRNEAVVTALHAYKDAKDRDATPTIEDSDIIDLLADLRHFCKAHNFHYEKFDNMAFQHFEEER